MVKERLLTKDFIMVAVINFFIYMTFYLLIVIIAAYTMEKFKASTSMAGLVAGIFIIGIIFGRLGAGRIIEAAGSKQVLVVGTICYLVTSLLYFAAANIALLVIIRFLHGVAYGIASTATGTIVAQIIPKSRQGEGIGLYSLSQILATALGPFAAIFLNRHGGFTTVIAVGVAFALVNLVISCLVEKPPAPTIVPGPREKSPNRFSLPDYFEVKALPISFVGLILGFGYSVVLSFLSLYARDIHLEGAAGYFFFVYAITVLVSRPFSGRLLDAKGSHFVVYPCLLLFAIGMLLLSRAGHCISILVAGSLIGLGYGNFLSCGQAISIKGAPSHRLGLATATYYIFLDLGFGIGPYLFGYLIPVTGFRGLYGIMASMILSTIGLYYLLCQKKTGSA